MTLTLKLLKHLKHITLGYINKGTCMNKSMTNTFECGINKQVDPIKPWK